MGGKIMKKILVHLNNVLACLVLAIGVIVAFIVSIPFKLNELRKKVIRNWNYRNTVDLGAFCFMACFLVGSSLVFYFGIPKNDFLIFITGYVLIGVGAFIIGTILGDLQSRISTLSFLNKMHHIQIDALKAEINELKGEKEDAEPMNQA